MKSVIIILAAIGLALASNEASAKTPPSYRDVPPSDAQRWPAIVAGPHYRWPWHHAATVQESWAIGNAIWIEAVGVYNLYSSIAASYWESARHAAIDNWAYRIRTWYQIRDGRKARDRAEHPLRTSEQQRAITQMRDPPRLSGSQLSAAGGIRWPEILQAAEFAEGRQQLEAMFAQSARWLENADELAGEIDAAAIGMKKALDQSPGASPHLVRSADKFLDSLRLEARLRSRGSGRGQLAAANRQ
jgi:hypothetical protein